MANATSVSNSEPVQEANFPTAIVGPNPLLCESLSRILHESVFNVVALALRIDGLAPETLPHDRPTLLIIDACNNPAEVLEQIGQFRQNDPETRIVVLANHCATNDVTQVLQTGACGYLATVDTCENFIKSLELVMEGQTILPSEGVSSVFDRKTMGAHELHRQAKIVPLRAPTSADKAHVPKFSARELDVLRCLTEGSSNKLIARECDIMEATVKVHVKSILRKIKVKNRTQAAVWALSNRTLVGSLRKRLCGDTAFCLLDSTAQTGSSDNKPSNTGPCQRGNRGTDQRLASQPVI